ncbi:hypothetical protein C8R45DRAFT_1011778 [Mycena sanguinolenta]|nr:hypothetical protein C8R45DRAFT_1011778 [Mycena sanguinolenta]
MVASRPSDIGVGGAKVWTSEGGSPYADESDQGLWPTASSRIGCAFLSFVLLHPLSSGSLLPFFSLLSSLLPLSLPSFVRDTFFTFALVDLPHLSTSSFLLHLLYLLYSPRMSLRCESSIATHGHFGNCFVQRRRFFLANEPDGHGARSRVR